MATNLPMVFKRAASSLSTSSLFNSSLSTSLTYYVSALTHPAPPMEIQRWAAAQSGAITKKIGTDITVNEVFNNEKVDVKDIREYKAYGGFQCAPEDIKDTLLNDLAACDVPEKTIQAWTETVAKPKNRFIVIDKYNVTADGSSITGHHRGGLQIASLPNGDREVKYCIGGMAMKTAMKVKEHRKETKVEYGTRKVKTGWFSEKSESYVISEEISQVPIFYEQAVERKVHEYTMQMVERDATTSFNNLFPVVDEQVQHRNGASVILKLRPEYLIGGGVSLGALVLGNSQMNPCDQGQVGSRFDENPRALMQYPDNRSPMQSSTAPCETRESHLSESLAGQRHLAAVSIDEQHQQHTVVIDPTLKVQTHDVLHTGDSQILLPVRQPRGSVVLEVDQIVNPKKHPCLYSMIKDRYPDMHLEKPEGDRSYARVQVKIADAQEAKAIIKLIGNDKGKHVNVKEVQYYYESDSD